MAAAALEEHLGVGGSLGAELLQPRLGSRAHPEERVEPAEAAREAPQQAVGRVDAHQLPLHAHVVLLQVRQPHPHPRHLQLQLPVLPPHRRVVVPRRHRAAPHPAPGPHVAAAALDRRRGRRAAEEESPVMAEDAAAGAASSAGLDRAPQADLLEVEHLHRHLHRQPLVLGRVAARVRRKPLAVDRLAHPVPLRLLDVRVHLQEDVDGAVDAVGDEAGVVREDLGEGDELGGDEVRIQRDLGQVAVQQLRSLDYRALLRGPRAVVVEAAAPAAVLLGVLIKVEEHREDPRHHVCVVQRVVLRGGRRRRLAGPGGDQDVLQDSLVELHADPLLEVGLAYAGSGQRHCRLEEPREEGHWHGALLGLRRQQAHDGLDDGALFLDGVRIRDAAAFVGGLRVPAGHEPVERVLGVVDEDPGNRLLPEALGLDRGEQSLEEVQSEAGDRLAPPVPRRVKLDDPRRRLELRALVQPGEQPGRELLLADVAGDGGDEAGDEVGVLGGREQRLAGAQHGDGAGDAGEDGVAEERLGAELEVLVGEVVGHLQVARGAAEHGDVGDRDVDVDAVAELGGELERRGAPGRGVEGEARELGVLGLRHEPPDLAAPGHQRELREQLCHGASGRHFKLCCG
ncbi:hypothetical protein CFC21_096852 [Triticum aestivum]|uniref:Uncharacterized protein n=2 Tax=Triticum aestivum TaxID=4565 RepID=A0A3B6RC70_WHEAT|nr:hypothetical protein CFC21_096852 [Triticum aestivum]